jgi:hypothetical protein
MYSAEEWINIWNSSFTNGTDETLIFSEIIFPLNNLTLQFCHSYSLQAHPLLKKVTLIPKTHLTQARWGSLSLRSGMAEKLLA